jgi:hypothetical protein
MHSDYAEKTVVVQFEFGCVPFARRRESVHDWAELTDIAHQVLRHDHGCKTLHKIEAMAHSKYREALRITGQMRQRYLLPARGNVRPKSKRSGPVPVLAPVLVATSEIVA